MSKMHSGQLFAVLFLSGAWQVLTFMELCSPLAAAGAALLQLLLCLPMIALSRKGFSLSRFCAEHKWAGIPCILFFLLWGAQGFAVFSQVSPLLSLPFSGKLPAAALVAVTCLYTCSLGLKATARCAPFMLGIFLLSMAVLIAGAAGRMDTARLQMGSGVSLRSGIVYFCSSGELAAAWVLLDRTKGNVRRPLFISIAAKAGLCCLVTFLCMGAAGRLAQRAEHPFFILTALSQPLQEQRADSLYILVCVMLYILHITLQTGVIDHLLHAMYPGLRAAAPLSLCAMLLLTFAVRSLGDLAVPLFGGLLVLTAFLLPMTAWIMKRKEAGI